MDTIEKWVATCERIDAKALVFEAIKDALKEYRAQILELNKKQLEDKGIDSHGIKLPPYSIGYKKIRAAKGLPTDRMTLKFEGDFHDAFYQLVFDQFTEIGSRDTKAESLEKRYGDIFGLTDENLDKLFNEMGLFNRIRDIYNQKVKSL
jgi:hypothetical protein